jgi:hypothetical protein
VAAPQSYGDLAKAAVLCDVYPAQIRAQLKRYGTNIAKWGFNVCALHDFNDLRQDKNGTKSAFNNFRVISFTTSLGQQDIANR